jgi:hypothetical protein
MKYFSFLRTKFSDNSSYEIHDLHTYLDDYKYEIDEKTYIDLMLPEFKEKYNNTITSCGDEVFNHWLRIIKKEKDIISLQKDLNQIVQNSDTILVSNLFHKLGKQKHGNIITDLWNVFTVRSLVIDKFFYILVANVCFSSLIFIFNSKLLPISMMFFFLVNLGVYILTNSKISRISGSINYFIDLCNSLKKMKRKTNIEISLSFPQYQLFKNISWCSVLFKEGFGGAQSQDLFSIFIDYLRVFLGLEVIAYKATARFIVKHKESVRDIIYYIGYLDCLINSKSIIEKNDIVVSEIKDTKSIEFVNMKHPLIVNSIGQTKTIEKGIIITGLNMAGKTSFMKSLGLNQLLATSFGLAFASKFQTSVFKIMTSFRINDNLLGNQSRYYAEASRLIEIMDKLQHFEMLCLIDEILSGTNSDDRIYGATVILKKYYGYANSIVIAATHDNKIAENLLDEYDPIYFDGEIVDKKFNFDYTIKNGIVSKRNGLLILKLLGIDMEKENESV